MIIEIFEAGGFSLSTDTNALLINMYNKKGADFSITKIDVTDAAAMKNHKDVVKILKKEGIDALPLLKLNGRLLKEDKFLQTIQKRV